MNFVVWIRDPGLKSSSLHEMHADARLSMPINLVSVSNVAILGADTDAVIAIALQMKSVRRCRQCVRLCLPFVPPFMLFCRWRRFVLVEVILSAKLIRYVSGNRIKNVK